MRLPWHDLGTPRADKADGKLVELSGFPLAVPSLGSADHFLMMAEPGCCQGCVPANRLAVVEVFADQPLKFGTGQLQLAGTWQVSSDPDGWRYQLRGAGVKPGVTRRALMAASPLFCLPVPAMAQAADGMAVDIHSHAGNLIPMSFGRGQFSPVAEPMRQGGMAVICLAVVADSPTIKLTDGRLRPSRDPRPGELYAHTQRAFERLHRLVREQGLRIVSNAAEPARGARRAAIGHRLVGGRRFPRGQARACRRGLPALAAAPSAAHALSAERAGRHPDRAPSMAASRRPAPR